MYDKSREREGFERRSVCYMARSPGEDDCGGTGVTETEVDRAIRYLSGLASRTPGPLVNTQATASSTSPSRYGMARVVVQERSCVLDWPILVFCSLHSNFYT